MLSLLAIAIILIPALLIILILKLTGDREAFFFQPRIGMKKEVFTCWKFVTMRSDSEETGTGKITIKNDPRVTPIGQFLRKTKLNELPQFINVLKGDMSLVGPRPLTPEGFGFYMPDIQDVISRVKPGITGIGSIVFRDEEQILGKTDKPYEQVYREEISPYKGALEEWYIRHHSTWLDLKILFLTVLAVIYPGYSFSVKSLLGLSNEQWRVYEKAIRAGQYAQAAPLINKAENAASPLFSSTVTTPSTANAPASSDAAAGDHDSNETNHSNRLTPDDKVLVIGGSGFIGTHLHEALEKAGIKAVNYDLHPITPKRPGVLAYEGDIRDYPALEYAMNGCTAVINLAAAHNDPEINQEILESVNIDGTANICRAMSYHGIKKCAFYSSVMIYGSKPFKTSEKSMPAPEDLHARTKLAGECEYADWLGEDSGRRCLIIRPTAVFGPNSFNKLFQLIRQIDNNGLKPAVSSQNTKSICFVKNLVDATLYLWSRQPGDLADSDGLEIYNYSDKPNMASNQIVSTIYRALGKNEPALKLPYRLAIAFCLPFDLIRTVTGINLSISSAPIKELAKVENPYQTQKINNAGFKPETPLDAAIEETVKWYLESGKHSEVSKRIPPEWSSNPQQRAAAAP